MALRGRRFRDRRKRGEPQDRQRDETSPRGRRGASRRGGAKPRGRNAGGCGTPLRRARKRLGVDSSAHVDGGAIFGQPQERKPGGAPHRRVARTGTCRARRHEGQEGRAPIHANGRMRTGRRSLEGRASRASVAPRPWRAVANANAAMTSIGSSPRGRHPVGVVTGRGPWDASHRRGGVEASAPTPACPVARGRRLRRRKVRRQTLETP